MRNKLKGAVLVVSAGVWLQACCFPYNRTDPPMPNDAVGWKDFKEDSTQLRGRFLLKKGESTSNGKVAIRVLELIPPNCYSEAGSEQRLARVRLQFIRVSDQQVLCSDAYPEHGGGSLAIDCPRLAENFGVDGVGVRAINLKEGWVYFIITGYY